jgi:hypothetical protein
MKHVEEFLSLLDGVSKAASGWKARCPCPEHNDRTPSLSISISDNDQRILVHCHSGCTKDAILEAVGMDDTDLWPRPGDLDGDDDVVESAAHSRVEPDLALIHQVYSALLAKLSLSETHRTNLRERGLTDDQIDRAGYRTLSFFEFHNKAVVALRAEFGEKLLTVPGFVSKNGTVSVIESPNGILIPVRDAQGQIHGLQIRSDNGDPKYRWFSGGDVSSGSPAHVPLGMKLDTVLRITEGPLKADIAFAIDGIATIAVAGVANWRSALPVLEVFGVKTARVAFDADSQVKRGVAQTLVDFSSELKERYELQLDTWPLAQGKGLDDILVAGGKPTTLTGDDDIGYLDRLLTQQNDPLEDESQSIVAKAPEPVPKAQDTPCVDDATTRNETTETDHAASKVQKGPNKFPYGDGDPVPFPTDFFPNELQAIVGEISTAVSCPPDLVACAMVSAAATAIGRSRQLEPKADWKICPRLYVALVCEPGGGKTPALTKVMKPLWRQNQEWHQEYVKAFAEFEVDSMAYEVHMKEYVRGIAEKTKQAKVSVRDSTLKKTASRTFSAPGRRSGRRRDEARDEIDSIDVIADAQSDEATPSSAIPAVQGSSSNASSASQVPRSDDHVHPPQKPGRPLLKQVMTNDVTIEKLAVIMSQNPRGVIRMWDELSGFIQTMNQYHGGHGADRQFYLSGWSGSPVQVDRKSLDTPIIVREPFINILGGIQPDMLGSLEDERGREDGFIHRFLFSYPMPVAQGDWDSSTGVSQQARGTWNDIVAWLFNLAQQSPGCKEEGGESQPRTLLLTEEAEKEWAEWFRQHWEETAWDCFPGHLRGVWSKFVVHALSLILVAHMLAIGCDHVSSNKMYSQVDPPIDAESVRRGLKLADYFKHHNVRVLSRLKVSKEDLSAKRLLEWIRKRPERRATARELQQNEVVGIKTSSKAKGMLKDLEDRGWGEMKSISGMKKGEYFQAA